MLTKGRWKRGHAGFLPASLSPKSWPQTWCSAALSTQASGQADWSPLHWLKTPRRSTQGPRPGSNSVGSSGVQREKVFPEPGQGSIRPRLRAHPVRAKQEAGQEAREHQETSAREVPTGKGRPTLERRVPPSPRPGAPDSTPATGFPWGRGSPRGPRPRAGGLAGEGLIRPPGTGARHSEAPEGPGTAGRTLSHGCQDRRRRELGQHGPALQPRGGRSPLPTGTATAAGLPVTHSVRGAAASGCSWVQGQGRTTWGL